MRRTPLLALSAALLGLVPVAAAVAGTGPVDSPSIAVDVPPDFVRYGADLPLSGTVFTVDGRRAVKNPVTVATWDVTLEQYVWGKTVVTDANGRFRTSVRADSRTGQNVLLVPTLNGVNDPDGAGEELLHEAVPTVKVQYPVTVRVGKDTKDPAALLVSGSTPECEDAHLQVQAAFRGPFQDLGEPVTCTDGKFAATFARPGTGTWMYRVVRAGDAVSVPTVSTAVPFR